ncbi:DUF2573 family protein [Bacillus velezensis]|nr:DUF2573 family protein [Bacillus velezensis]MDL5023988.1 DUF2573 family protein [Bacillus velezensis]MEC3610103.1 DUF2573 family protein [Bacillus velezensis]MEC3679161.1 DUF2573 family protein [Bacillus velezensis]
MFFSIIIRYLLSVKHWNESCPDAKEGIKAAVQHIKQLNEEHRKKQ